MLAAADGDRDSICANPHAMQNAITGVAHSNGFMSAQAPDIGEGIIPACRQAGVCETDAGAGATGGAKRAGFEAALFVHQTLLC